MFRNVFETLIIHVDRAVSCVEKCENPRINVQRAVKCVPKCSKNL